MVRVVNEPDFRLKSLLTSCPDIAPTATEDVTVERIVSATDIERGNNPDVTLSIEGIRASEIVETIPGGFTVAGADHPADRYGNSGQKVLSSAIGETAVRTDGMPGCFHDGIDRPDYFQTSPRGENNYRFANATFNGLIGDLGGTLSVTQRKAIGDELLAILSEQVPCVPVCSMASFDAFRSDRFACFASPFLKDGGDINILSHIRQASAEVSRYTRDAGGFERGSIKPLSLLYIPIRGVSASNRRP